MRKLFFWILDRLGFKSRRGQDATATAGQAKKESRSAWIDASF